jgi:hypothetical protein
MAVTAHDLTPCYPGRKVELLRQVRIDTMSIVEYTVQLPESLSREAEAAGIKMPGAVEDLLREELRRRQAKEFIDLADRLAKTGAPPLTPAEIEAEIEAARSQRRSNARRS